MKLPPLTMITNHNRNIARTVMLAAVLFFSWRMASVLWLLAGQDRADLIKPTLAPVSTQTTTVDSSRLASFSVFKVVAASNSADTANAPETNLQLKLDGVFASNNAEQSSAIISEQGQGIGKLYRVGQQVSGGATLSAVYVDRVLLQRNGVDEHRLVGDQLRGLFELGQCGSRGNAGPQYRLALQFVGGRQGWQVVVWRVWGPQGGDGLIHVQIILIFRHV